MSLVAKVSFRDAETSVTQALDIIGAGAHLARASLIILKPNLTTAAPPPVTTSVQTVAAAYKYCRRHSGAEIAIAEGCGSGTTAETFARNGYTRLADEHGIRLIDLNEEKSVLLKRADALQEREFHLPEVLLAAFVISIPVLKDHCFTQTTVAMKNMFGIAPAPHYCGGWNKSRLHSPSTHAAVVDVCLYKPPSLCLVDANVALSGMHLSGTPRQLGLILASFDPVAVDAVASELLGHDPAGIEYLRLADGRVGSLNGIEIRKGD